jgi:hypothetical protein
MTLRGIVQRDGMAFERHVDWLRVAGGLRLLRGAVAARAVIAVVTQRSSSSSSPRSQAS